MPAAAAVVDSVPMVPSERRRNPLRDAEAPPAAYRPPSVEGPAGGLDSFGAARTARREKALEVAKVGMSQVAEERRAAEEEEASRKTAAAQAEAEALEQRKNSFAGRVKQVLTATISAAGGAFFGGIGSRAGEAAAEAVFKNR